MSQGSKSVKIMVELKDYQLLALKIGFGILFLGIGFEVVFEIFQFISSFG